MEKLLSFIDKYYVLILCGMILTPFLFIAIAMLAEAIS